MQKKYGCAYDLKSVSHDMIENGMKVRQMEIYNKYKIEHTDGTPLKGKKYFVLRLDSDDPIEAARVERAMRAYEGNPRNCDKYPDFNDAITTLAKKRGWTGTKWDSERYCILAHWLLDTEEK